MALLLDIFGFLSVLLRGLTITAQSLCIGGIAFLVLLARPLADEVADGLLLLQRSTRLAGWSAIALAVATAADVALATAMLIGTADLSFGDALGAQSVLADLVVLAAALLVAGLCLGAPRRTPTAALAALAVVVLAAQTATSHAVARVEDRAPLALAGFLHQAAAAVWIGGIPYLVLALAMMRDGVSIGRVGKRFSTMSVGSVGVLVAAGFVMSLAYIGSLEALYGTAYGVMVGTKVALLGFLLFLGGMNYLLVDRVLDDPRTPTKRFRRFAEVEVGIGITVFFAAASLTSLPPASDLTQDRATLQEIAERLAPQWPRLESPDHASLAIPELQAKLDAENAAAAARTANRPQAFVPGAGEAPPRNAEDIAWSEYNHHWAGIFVLAVGLLALAERSRRASWARHWPLLFIGLAVFLFVRSDPETWPLGDVGFIESFRDPEVVQHRVFVVLIVAFGLFEWGVRNGRIQSEGAALVFPLITAVGGGLLLTHSHALANVKEQFLIEISHVPLALLGILAGWTRWLELRLPPPGNRLPAWAWPVCFVLVGLLLLSYREA
jgi:putative copper resistance protein D